MAGFHFGVLRMLTLELALGYEQLQRVGLATLPLLHTFIRPNSAFIYITKSFLFHELQLRDPLKR